jgi:hypothetical protein
MRLKDAIIPLLLTAPAALGCSGDNPEGLNLDEYVAEIDAAAETESGPSEKELEEAAEAAVAEAAAAEIAAAEAAGPTPCTTAQKATIEEIETALAKVLPAAQDELEEVMSRYSWPDIEDPEEPIGLAPIFISDAPIACANNRGRLFFPAEETKDARGQEAILARIKKRKEEDGGEGEWTVELTNEAFNLHGDYPEIVAGAVAAMRGTIEGLGGIKGLKPAEGGAYTGSGAYNHYPGWIPGALGESVELAYAEMERGGAFDPEPEPEPEPETEPEEGTGPEEELEGSKDILLTEEGLEAGYTGLGTYIYEHGQYFAGEWRDGKPVKGTLTGKSKVVEGKKWSMTGTIEDGILTGEYKAASGKLTVKGQFVYDLENPWLQHKSDTEATVTHSTGVSVTATNFTTRWRPRGEATITKGGSTTTAYFTEEGELNYGKAAWHETSGGEKIKYPRINAEKTLWYRWTNTDRCEWEALEIDENTLKATIRSGVDEKWCEEKAAAAAEAAAEAASGEDGGENEDEPEDRDGDGEDGIHGDEPGDEDEGEGGINWAAAWQTIKAKVAGDPADDSADEDTGLAAKARKFVEKPYVFLSVAALAASGLLAGTFWFSLRDRRRKRIAESGAGPDAFKD